MAAHHLTIAKAAFAASLMLPDVSKINRDDLPHFHALFEGALAKPSIRNIQTCKQWLLDNILSSTRSTIAFSKYLLSYCKHIQTDDRQKLPISRYRLHVLYLLNDLLHHAKHHAPNKPARASLHDGLQSILPSLFQIAAAEQRTKILTRLEDLLALWEGEQYFEREIYQKIRSEIANPISHVVNGTSNSSAKPTTKELPYMMPATHGDTSLPFHELPAANLMPHIVPNRTISIRPDSVRALHFSPGPADERLVNALKDFLEDIDSVDNVFISLEDDRHMCEIDEMGQVIYCNEAGDLVGESYYGWSRDFCEKMKSRRKSAADPTSERGRLRSYSSSESRSRSNRKRQRHSYSSGSNSSRSRSRSPSLSRPRLHDRNGRRSPLGQRSRSPAHEPARVQPSLHTTQMPGSVHAQSFPTSSPGPVQWYQAPSMPIMMVPPPSPGGFPIPPPRPPNWSGPWPPLPPPPPPLPMNNGPFPGQHHPNMSFSTNPSNVRPPPPHSGWYGSNSGRNQ